MSSDLSKKKKSGFLARKAQSAKEKSNNIQPDDVLMFTAPTEGNNLCAIFTEMCLFSLDCNIVLAYETLFQLLLLQSEMFDPKYL